jgi:hypothetical protein
VGGQRRHAPQGTNPAPHSAPPRASRTAAVALQVDAAAELHARVPSLQGGRGGGQGALFGGRQGAAAAGAERACPGWALGSAVAHTDAPPPNIRCMRTRLYTPHTGHPHLRPWQRL